MREIQALDPTVDPDQTIRHFLFWPLGQSQGSGGAHQPNAAPAINKAKPARGDFSAQRGSGGGIFWAGTGGGAGKDAYPAHGLTPPLW